MGFETQRHRGTQRKVMEAAQRTRARVRPKPSGFTPKSANPAKSPAPQSPLPHTRLTPNTQRSAENCPYRAKLHGGGLTWHCMPG
jgi:hypothetical protein